MALIEKTVHVGQQLGQVAAGTFYIGASSSGTSEWTYVETGFRPRAIELTRVSINSSGYGKRLIWHEGMYVVDDSTTPGVVGSTARNDDFHCFVFSSAGAPLKVPCTMPTSSQAAIGTTGYPSSQHAGVYVDDRGFYVGCSSSGILGERHASTGNPPRPMIAFKVTG
jgi:hypothetical protein